jgi:hypothetical protein
MRGIAQGRYMPVERPRTKQARASMEKAFVKEIRKNTVVVMERETAIDLLYPKLPANSPEKKTEMP